MEQNEVMEKLETLNFNVSLKKLYIDMDEVVDGVTLNTASDDSAVLKQRFAVIGHGDENTVLKETTFFAIVSDRYKIIHNKDYFMALANILFSKGIEAIKTYIENGVTFVEFTMNTEIEGCKLIFRGLNSYSTTTPLQLNILLQETSNKRLLHVGGVNLNIRHTLHNTYTDTFEELEAFTELLTQIAKTVNILKTNTILREDIKSIVQKILPKRSTIKLFSILEQMPFNKISFFNLYTLIDYSLGDVKSLVTQQRHAQKIFQKFALVIKLTKGFII